MKNILSSLIIFISLSAFSQSDLKSKFTDDLNTIVQLTNSNEFSKLMDFTNPKMFDIASRDQLIEVFENMISMGMETKGGIARINHISDAIAFDNKIYYKIYYRSDMNFKISGQLLDGLEGMKEYFFSTLAPKAKDIRFDDKTNTFFIEELQQVMIAESSLNSDNWSYIEYRIEDPQQAQILEYIFPAQVLEKLK
tara:strand:+ start:697 stop:1281 length:585 start_codon:yes stop_codon:yes gene_type:complete